MTTNNIRRESKSKSLSLVTEELKAKAEVYYGDKICREKFSLLLAEKGLPDGLLTVEDIEECGHVKELGFVWLKLGKKMEHRFDNIHVCYDPVVTAYVEPNKIKNLTGVKARDFLIWFNLNEIFVKEPPSSEAEGEGCNFITFKSFVGLSMSFPVSLFQGGKLEGNKEEPKEDKWWRMIKF